MQSPASPLGDFVQCLWTYDTDGSRHAAERLLPDGTMELVVELREDIAGAPGELIGAHAASFLLDTAGPVSVIGAHFRPGGAFPFFRPPAGEFQGSIVSIDNVWGGAALELRERLLETPEPADRFRLLERFLLARLARPLARHPSVAFALHQFAAAGAAPTVTRVLDRTGLSQRRFIEVFSDQVGLTPKLYCRLQRFQRAVRHLETGRDVDLAGLALDCGYYDQAHFNHDFKDFSGLSPTAFLAQWAGRHNHVPHST